MAEYLITLSPSEKYRVTVPEGTTQEQAYAILQGQQAQSNQPRESLPMQGAKAVARGALDLPIGVLESYGKLQKKFTGDTAPTAFERAAAPIKQLRQSEALQGPVDSVFDPKTFGEQVVGTGGELIGGQLPLLPFGGGTLAQKAFSTLAPAVGGVAGEQLIGGEWGKTVGAIAGPFAQAGLSKVVNPNISEDVKKLIEGGVKNLTPGYAYGGLTGKAERAPIVSALTAPARNRVADQYNQATLNYAIAPLRQQEFLTKSLGKMQIDDIGFEGFKKADEIANKAYETILPNLRIQVKNDNLLELEAIRRALPTRDMRNELTGIFNTKVAPYFDSPTRGNTILQPEKFKNVLTDLGVEYNRFVKDPAARSQEMAKAIADMRSTINEMAARQNPTMAGPLRAADEVWANLVRVGNATNASPNTGGVFSPNVLQEAVRSSSNSLRNRKFAKGEAVMQDWSNSGMKVLGAGNDIRIPYSAALRGLALPVAGFGAAAAPVYGWPLAAGVGGVLGLYNPLTQKAMASLYTQRPDWMRQAGAALKPDMLAARAAVPLFTQQEQ